MYEERKDKFTLKDVIIQILFIGVFIFLLMWLFPMKSSVKKSFAPIYDQIFNNNVDAMKESAITYFTTPRLPQKVGEEVKMTLSDMLEKNIILPFVDSKGNQCDLLESYVSMTKMNDEYILKVNLKCGEQEDYLLVHLGCYDYCDGDVCEKEPEKEPEKKPETPVKPVNPTPQKQYKYEYVKVIDGKWGEYSAWTDWNTNVITATDYRQVETKVETETTMKTETITTEETVYEDKRVAYTDYETRYKTVSVKTGTVKVPHTTTVTKYKTVTKEVPYETTESYQDCKEVPKYKTVVVSSSLEWVCNDSCSWQKKDQTKVVQDGTKQECTTKQRPVTKTKTITENVPYEEEVTTYTEEDVYEDIEEEYEVPVTKYRTEKVPVTKEVTKTIEVPVTKNITYYRSRTREYISGTIDTKWSTSQNDKTLISQGYSLTGNSCEVGVNCSK